MNIKSDKWSTKPWSKLHFGPVMDSTCTSLHWNGKFQVTIAGGWNNSVLYSTELFHKDTWRWKEVTKPINFLNSTMALPYGVRSAVMGELDRKPFLAGGVKCEK